MRLGISGSAAVALLVGALVALPAVGAAPSLSFGVMTVSSGGAAPRSVAAGDFNGDGQPDLAVANTDLLTVAGPVAPALVRVFATSAGGEATRGFVFDPPFAGGAYVAGE
jgi:FG-GAP repeat